MLRRERKYEVDGEWTLYTREGCTLCELLERRLRRLVRGQLALRHVDVDADPALRERYGVRLPVLVHDGREVCEGRVDPEELAATLERLAVR